MIKKDVGILLVEDHGLSILGIHTIASEPDSHFKILSDAQNDEEALDNLRKTTDIDLVIMDYRLNGSNLNGVALTKKIIEEFPKVKVLFCSTDENELTVRDAKKVGARGYIFKHQPGKDIRKVIESEIDSVMKGYFSWPKEQQIPRFTPKELEIIDLLRSGCADYKEIAFLILKIEHDGNTDNITAEMLEMKKRNVEKHASNIMHKLSIHSLHELIRWIVDIERSTKELSPNSSLRNIPPTGILVIDDYRLQVLNIFDSLLENVKDYQIIAQVESGEQALNLLQDGKVQLVIVNSHRSDDAMNDVQLAEKLGKEYPQVKVLFYGPETDVETVEKVKSVAASGYIWGKEYRSINQHIDHQDKRARDLKKAIKEIMIGRKVFRCNPPLKSD